MPRPWEGQGLMTNAANWLSHTTSRSGRNMWGPRASAPLHHQNSFFRNLQESHHIFPVLDIKLPKSWCFFMFLHGYSPQPPHPSGRTAGKVNVHRCRIPWKWRPMQRFFRWDFEWGKKHQKTGQIARGMMVNGR